jgi:hypothetical protein
MRVAAFGKLESRLRVDLVRSPTARVRPTFGRSTPRPKSSTIPRQQRSDRLRGEFFAITQ